MSSKNTRLQAKSVKKKKTSKRAKLGKKLSRSKTSEATTKSHSVKSSVAGIPVSSSAENKRNGANENQSDDAALENGPLESSMLKIKSPAILAPVKLNLPLILVPKRRKHSKNKHYLCSECGRELKSKSALDIHLRMHTDSRPFTCPICGRGFRANGGLTRHQVLSIETLLSVFFLTCFFHTICFNIL